MVASTAIFSSCWATKWHTTTTTQLRLHSHQVPVTVLLMASFALCLNKCLMMTAATFPRSTSLHLILPSSHYYRLPMKRHWMMTFSTDPREVPASGGDCHETSELPRKWNVDPNIYVPCPSLCPCKAPIKEGSSLCQCVHFNPYCGSWAWVWVSNSVCTKPWLDTEQEGQQSKPPIPQAFQHHQQVCS